MKKIAIIPARSGSKGLKDKNILNLGGKPLIAWTIESAKKSECFDRIIVTTDSEEYGDICKRYGADVIYRSKETSTDTASMYEVIKELFDKINIDEYDYFALLQPTSPLRNEVHIKEAIKLFEENFETKNTLVSVTKASKSSILINPIEEDLSLKHFNKDYSNYARQNYNEYETNGAIFISKIEHYLNKKDFFGESGIAYIMDRESSIDINDQLDFELAFVRANKINKYEIKLKAIQDRIEIKKELFKRKINNKNTVALIGNCQIDNWNIKKFLKYKVINYGIAGISSFQYNDMILSKNLLQCDSNIYIVMHGLNDIIGNKTNKEIYESIMKNIEYIKNRNKDAIICFIACLNVNGRMDRSNDKIYELNKYLKKKMENSINWIDTNSFNNKFGKLDEKYTFDGMHLNENGYEKLKEIIEDALKKL